MACVNQRHIHDTSTYRTTLIVLQFKGIENELYVGLAHILCITVITVINIVGDDKDCLYLQQESHNVILILFMATISSINIDIMHISMAYQYRIVNPSPTHNPRIKVLSLTTHRPFTDPLLTPQQDSNYN